METCQNFNKETLESFYKFKIRIDFLSPRVVEVPNMELSAEFGEFFCRA